MNINCRIFYHIKIDGLVCRGNWQAGLCIAILSERRVVLNTSPEHPLATFPLTTYCKRDKFPEVHIQWGEHSASVGFRPVGLGDSKVDVGVGDQVGLRCFDNGQGTNQANSSNSKFIAH